MERVGEIILYNWWNLSPVWEAARVEARKRDRQKRQYKTAKYMSQQPNFWGILGEHVCSLEFGWKRNSEILAAGDGGEDFPGGIDAKCVTYWRDPYLKEFIRPKFWKKSYALVVVDQSKKRGSYVGWTTKKELQEAPIEDFGHGERLSLHFSVLRTGVPPCQ